MPNTREKLIEVKKALEFCFKQGMTSDCNGCAYKGHEGGVCMDVLMEDALVVINHLGEKQATSDESKWIPVTERLPESKTKVLVYGGNDLIRVDGVNRPMPSVYTGYMRGLDEGWFTWDEQKYIAKVTHWMYMPEPPKGE